MGTFPGAAQRRSQLTGRVVVKSDYLQGDRPRPTAAWGSTEQICPVSQPKVPELGEHTIGMYAQMNYEIRLDLIDHVTVLQLGKLDTEIQSYVTLHERRRPKAIGL